jgi:hypothetical protein
MHRYTDGARGITRRPQHGASIASASASLQAIGLGASVQRCTVMQRYTEGVKAVRVIAAMLPRMSKGRG